MTKQTTTTTYYDSTLNFAGYINRARVVAPKKGHPYLAVSLCVLSGPMDEPNKMYIDAIVSGKEAKTLVEESMDIINSKVSVFGRFRVADLSLSTYENKQGDTIPIAKGRLILISYLKSNDDSIMYNRSDAAISQETDVKDEDVNETAQLDVKNDVKTNQADTQKANDETIINDSHDIEVIDVDAEAYLNSLSPVEKAKLAQALLGNNLQALAS